jgi:tRNA dimethylallyltransferase
MITPPHPETPLFSGPLLILGGPTGVGKTEVALAVARRARGEILVADSMQVYRGLDIGTGKPSAAERREIPHHLLDICDPTERFSAFAFAARARLLAAEVRARGRLPILVGGTGLYLRAFLTVAAPGRGEDAGIRARLLAEAERDGPEALHRRLRAVDPASAERIAPADRVRLVRALELWELTGTPPSTLRPNLWEASRLPGLRFVVLTRERDELRRRIDRRCVRMWEAGLVAELQGLLTAGYARELRPLQALGYRQALAVLEGRMDAAAALAAMQQATRNYAKRQLTWFRREPAATWETLAGEDWDAAATAILDRLEKPQLPNEQ